MAVDKNLKEKIDSIPSTQPKGLKLGGCARCREYGRLTRVPWEDPYLGKVAGVGFAGNVSKSQSLLKDWLKNSTVSGLEIPRIYLSRLILSPSPKRKIARNLTNKTISV